MADMYNGLKFLIYRDGNLTQHHMHTCRITIIDTNQAQYLKLQQTALLTNMLDTTNHHQAQTTRHTRAFPSTQST